MNVEGVAPIITTEWLQTVLTCVPMVIAGAWLVYGPIVLWRRLAWDAGGVEMRALTARWQGELRPWWAGWSVSAPGRRVCWSGGLWGRQTVVKLDEATVHKAERWLTADEVDAVCRSARG